jgi:hypothetical protein
VLVHFNVLCPNTGLLEDKYLAPILSHHTLFVEGVEIFSSYNKVCIHIISAVAFAKALYSDFVLDLDIVAYFLALHETRFDPR